MEEFLQHAALHQLLKQRREQAQQMLISVHHRSHKSWNVLKK